MNCLAGIVATPALPAMKTSTAGSMYGVDSIPIRSLAPVSWYCLHDCMFEPAVTQLRAFLSPEIMGLKACLSSWSLGQTQVHFCIRAVASDRVIPAPVRFYRLLLTLGCQHKRDPQAILKEPDGDQGAGAVSSHSWNFHDRMSLPLPSHSHTTWEKVSQCRASGFESAF